SAPSFFAYTGRIADSIGVGKLNLTTGTWAWNERYLPLGTYTLGRGLDIKFHSGNLYTCGIVYNSTVFNDAFIMKLNGAGGMIYFNTKNGSSGSYDQGAKLVVNSSGDAFVYGTTYSPGYRFWLIKYNSVGGEAGVTYYDPPVGEVISHPVDMVINNTFNKIITIGQTFNGGLGNGVLAVFDPSSMAISYSTVVDYGSNENFAKMVIDNTGNFYLGGMYNVGTFVVSKYDASNNFVFDAYYSTSVSNPVGLHVDNTGNTYIAGNIYPGGFSAYDVVIAKFSSTGSFLWDGYYDAQVNGYDNPAQAHVDASGNITIVGNITNSATQFDAFVRKFDAAGNIMWTNSIDYGSVSNTLVGSSKDNSENIILATSNPSGVTDITKIDPSGNVLWNALVPVIGGAGFTTDASGDFYIGESYAPGQSTFNIGKYTFLGVPVWSSTPTGSSYDMVLNRSKTDASGNLYAFGIRVLGGSNWLHVEKYNSAGVWQWGTTIMGHDSTQFVE
ncbi:MAG TPA: hypothetical protein VD905_11575, partial [Flavobacteriales bacterium]|nr:hypothetical protein [Flavobacteriales bacterium]